MAGDPYKNFRFFVEINSVIKAGFAECSGFGSELEVIEYREGGDDATVRKLRGKVKYPDITLKWGITDSLDLYNWGCNQDTCKTVPRNAETLAETTIERSQSAS